MTILGPCPTPVTSTCPPHEARFIDPVTCVVNKAVARKTLWSHRVSCFRHHFPGGGGQKIVPSFAEFGLSLPQRHLEIDSCCGEFLIGPSFKAEGWVGFDGF